MNDRLRQLVAAYDPDRPLERASTIPAAWYLDAELAELEREAVFGGTWQFIGRTDQLHQAGSYVAARIADEPIVAVRGGDRALRAFFNVCRHHAAEVVTEPQGRADRLRCPYHGWTYSLEGELRGVPEFEGVCDFDRGGSGLVPVRVGAFEPFVFVCLDPAAPELADWLGGMVQRVAPLRLGELKFVERRSYELACNWKVYVDNYLDGGYHVPHIHRALGSVLVHAAYRVECFDRVCLQSSPVQADAQRADAETAAVRTGDMAYYFWLYPNLMLNWYEGVMDVNIVRPLGVDRCEVVFDFYFADADAFDRNRQSMHVAERIQQEDIAVCESVQRGLRSRAYDTGRLSVRREAGEHLFHRLLHADLTRQLDGAAGRRGRSPG